MNKLITNPSQKPQEVGSQVIQFTRSERIFIGRDAAIRKLNSTNFYEGSPVVLKYKKTVMSEDTLLLLAIGINNGVGEGNYEIVSDSEVIVDYFGSDNEGKSYIWIVEDTDGRLAIPEDRRISGMLVFQKDENRFYLYNTDEDFEVFKPEASKLIAGNVEDEKRGKLTFLTSNKIYNDYKSAEDRLYEVSHKLSYGEPIVLKYLDGPSTKLILGVGTGVPRSPISIIGSYETIEDLYDKIGELRMLVTEDKSSIVNAINEVAKKVNVINGDYTQEGSMKNHLYEYNKSLLVDPGTF